MLYCTDDGRFGSPFVVAMAGMIGVMQAALLPSGLATLLFLVGAVALAMPRARRMACVALAAAAAVMVLFSNGLVATLLLSPLEYAFPALQDPRQHPDASVIVVLTAYAAEDTDLPLSSKPNGSSAFRVVEAANLRSLRPDCRIVVSGSDVAARIMGQQLQLLGVPAELLSVDTMSDSTAASAEYVRTLVGDAPVFLVTSAGHMRRAVGVFRKKGLVPIPAPTDYLLPRSAWHASWATSALHLQASDLAVHEYLGIAWYRLTDRL